MYAASTGSTQLCQILLSCCADVNKVSSDSKISLMIAAEAGHEQVAQLLLRSGADVDAYTGSEKPLLLAAATGRARLVRLLLEHGADVNDFWQWIKIRTYASKSCWPCFDRRTTA